VTSTSNYTARVRSVARWSGLVLVLAALLVFLMVSGLIPTIRLRVDDGPASFVAALAGAAAAASLGVTFLFLSFRGIDGLSVNEQGIVLPLRSPGMILRGASNLLPFDQVNQAAFIVTHDGRTLVEFVVRASEGQTRVLRYSTAWASDPSEFEQELSKRVRVRRDVN